jgi:hypothetical protein
LIAPPGAGKTTSVAPALIREAWCDGKVILLSPAVSPPALRLSVWPK